MKKGLRRDWLARKNRLLSLKTCPDEEGIKTSKHTCNICIFFASLKTCPDEEGIKTFNPRRFRTAYRLWKLALMKKGLRPHGRQVLAGVGPLKTCPDEEGIKTGFLHATASTKSLWKLALMKKGLRPSVEAHSTQSRFENLPWWRRD